jgi:hypothetical protein
VLELAPGLLTLMRPRGLLTSHVRGPIAGLQQTRIFGKRPGDTLP